MERSRAMNKEGLCICIPRENAIFYFVSEKQKVSFIKNHVRYDAKKQPYLINRGWKRHSRFMSNYEYIEC